MPCYCDEFQIVHPGRLRIVQYGEERCQVRIQMLLVVAEFDGSDMIPLVVHVDLRLAVGDIQIDPTDEAGTLPAHIYAP
jgi:hypothetical protein